MKRVLSLIIVLVSILSFSTVGFSAEIAPEGTIRRKMQRGFLNIALSPFEISHEVVATQKYDSVFPTWIAGLVKGSAKAVGRVLIGTYEIVTLPIPFPSHYAPVIQPEFPWDLLNNKVRPETPQKAG